MHSLSLYEIASDFAETLDNAFDAETGEALPVFEEKRALFAIKSNAVAAYILNSESTVEAMTAHIKAMQARIKTQQSKIEWLRGYLASNMKLAGITEVKANDGTFLAKLYPDRDESVEIEDGATFPPELCNEPKPPTPSRSRIKDAILSGEPVNGARIVRKDRLVIR